jgi:predicted site-specific integrase-resolvase
MGRLISIGQASKITGVTVETLREWEKVGKIQSQRTEGGHRRYDLDQFTPQENRFTIPYARVSSHDQKPDLERQMDVLMAYCQEQRWELIEPIKDLGSGLNYKKKGLQRLISLILDDRVERLVITHKDRLLRFGSELIFTLCEQFGTQVIILNPRADTTFEEDLATDVLEIITVFSARLYGSRSRKNLKIMQKLHKIPQEISMDSDQNL